MGEKCIQLLHFLVVLLVFYGNTTAVGVSLEAKIRCMEREKQALLQFKETVVDADGVLSSWGSEEDKRDCCKWRGVRCNNRTGHVTKIDLSSSYMTGKIPLSTQLQSFNASAYSGNPQLCGLPLPNKCPGEEIVVKPHNNDTRSQEEEEEEDRFITLWFYISMGLGFAVGFLVVFGTILFSSSSRQAYFQFLDRIHNWLYVTTALNITRLQRRLGR